MEEEAQPRKSAFVSYAHHDGLEFMRRLGFALRFYVDIFGDRDLPPGPFPKYLYQEIEKRDFFLFVMALLNEYGR